MALVVVRPRSSRPLPARVVATVAAPAVVCVARASFFLLFLLFVLFVLLSRYLGHGYVEQE